MEKIYAIATMWLGLAVISTIIAHHLKDRDTSHVFSRKYGMCPERMAHLLLYLDTMLGVHPNQCGISKVHREITILFYEFNTSGKSFGG